MSTRTKSVEVWALADKSGFLLARGNPNAGKPDPGEQPCPPYHTVSFVYEKDFFGQNIVWAKRKQDLAETGAMRAWNRWCRPFPFMKVRPAKVRIDVVIDEEGESNEG